MERRGGGRVGKKRRGATVGRSRGEATHPVRDFILFLILTEFVLVSWLFCASFSCSLLGFRSFLLMFAGWQRYVLISIEATDVLECT